MANIAIDTEITGMPQLIAKIKLLANDKDKKKEMIAILRRIAADTVRVAKSEAPVGKRAARSNIQTRKVVYMPGNLKKSIGVIVAKRSEDPMVVVGPKALKQSKKFADTNYRVDGWYGHIVSYGHNNYRSGFKRKHSSSDKAKAHNSSGARSRSEGNPFMDRAYAKTKGQATQKTSDQIAKYVQKRIDALSR